MIKQNTFYSIARSLLGSFQFFFISVMVIHYTSFTNWGAFISLYLVWSICVLLINSGTKELLVKSVSQSPAYMWPIISHNTSLRLLLSLVSIAIIITLPIGSISEKVAMVVIILSRVLTSTFEGIIVYEKEFRQSFFVELFSFVVITVLIVICSYANALQPIHILLFLIAGDLVKVICYEWVFRLFKHYVVQSFSITQSIKQMLPFSGAGIIGFVMNKADLYLFGLFITNQELIGQYHILNTLSNLLIVVVSSLIVVRNKALFRMPLDKLSGIQRVYFKHSTGLILLGLLSFYLFSPMLFQYKVTLLQLLLIAITAVVFSRYMFYINLQMRLDNMKTVNKVLTLAGLISVVAGIVLIPYFQVEGALFSVALSNGVVLVAMHQLSKKQIVYKHFKNKQ
jgi:O-antigen/teichoic acid export membrane protein